MKPASQLHGVAGSVVVVIRRVVVGDVLKFLLGVLTDAKHPKGDQGKVQDGSEPKNQIPMHVHHDQKVDGVHQDLRQHKAGVQDDGLDVCILVHHGTEGYGLSQPVELTPRRPEVVEGDEVDPRENRREDEHPEDERLESGGLVVERDEEVHFGCSL